MSKGRKSILLGIESSCDDTGAAVLIDGKICSNVVQTQLIHQEFGGVVPEHASRAHLQNIIPVVDAALVKAGVSLQDLDGVAVSAGPGLLGSLMVGTSFAKGLAQALDIPLLAVDHLKAHVLSLFLDDQPPEFPYLCLLVSGGHTDIILVADSLKMTKLGSTRDDAAGEAFDKTAKLLGFPYPGGPFIDQMATMGNPQAFKLPQAKVEGLDFSFSGLKTAVRYLVRDQVKITPQFIEENKADLSASIQANIVATLISKFEKALQQHPVQHIGLAGGVSANSALRTAFEALGNKYKLQFHIPKFEFCTDNAAMIAMAGHFLFNKEVYSSMDLKPYAQQ